MKKILLFASALAGLFLAGSCQRENLEPAQTGFTYEISLPEVVQTKGEGGYNTYDLYYEVYKTVDATELAALTEPLFENKVEMTGNTHTLQLDLLNDQDYTVLFWANKEGGDYFNLADLRNVVIKQATSNNDDRDAFCGMDKLVQHDGTQSKTVELKRPFAQVNIATLVNNVDYDIAPKSSLVKFTEVPVAFNVFTGEPVAETEAVVTFDVNTVPSGSMNVNGTDYKKVAMNYVFVPEGTVEVYYEINTENGTVKNSIPNVPVKRNYRTNIIGNLLTSNATYTIEVKPGFEGDNGAHVEVINEGVTKNINGDYEITNVKGLAYAINNLFVDDNGVANTATFYVKPGIYDMAQQAINDITVTSGTLKVYDTEAVVTRSATTGSVIITGLSKPLIQTVEEDATVFFSGITITDFNGADDAAALVQNNEGKVVLADCQILDENGAPDLDTKLVGGNAPVEVEKGEEEAGDLIYTAEQLAAAFADESVESIALGADITLENTLVFPEGRTATLDLRGWKLTVNEPASKYAINNHGTLTIKDSYATGEVNARGIYNGYVAEGDHITDAKLTIESGTFNAMGTNGGAAVYNYGVAEINGGNFTSIGGYSLNNQGGASMTIAEGVKANNGVYNTGATLIINGGEIEGNRSGCHVVYSWNSTVTINGGTIHNNNSGNSTLMAAGTSVMTVNAGTFSIKDGRVEGNGNTWTSCLTDTQNTAVLTINGGTFNGGFRVQGGTTMTITDGIFNDVVGSGYNVYEGATVVITGGSYNFDVNKWCHKDYKAVKNAETAMWDVVEKVYVAQAGEEKYESLKDAVNAVMDGETITLVGNVTFNEDTRENSGGTWYEGLYYTGDKSFTIDLSGFTITQQNGAVNDYLFLFKNDGEKDNVITFKNGTLDAGTSAFCALCTSTTSTQKITINAENLNIIGNNSNGAVCKIRGGAEFNVKAGTIITGKDSYLGIECSGSTVNISEGAEIYQNGTTSYNGCLIGVGGNGVINVYGGYGKGVSGGLIAMTSGGTINVSGGEWIANTDGTFSNSNKSVLVAQSDKQYNAGAGNAVVNVTGGTYKGGYNCYGNAVGDAQINISGGNFNADPTNYLVEGYIATDGEGGTYNVIEKPKPVAKVGNTEYGSIDEAIANWTNNSTLTLLADVTLSDVVTLKSTEHHILDLGTYTMTAADKKNAIEIVPEGEGAGTAARSCLTINADATNPGSMNAGSKACVYYKKTNGINDRIMVTFNGGIFNGTISSSSDNGGQACPYFVFNGGVFNKSINLTKAMLKVTGGIFHGMFSCTGDSTAHRLISGGTFKSWLFMTADAANKFCVGTDKQTYNVGVYVNDEGYLVVGGPVITEFGDKFAAKATNATKWSSYLQYSSAAANGLYYTNAEAAIKKHGEANVVLK